jgi:hypothetical protein
MLELLLKLLSKCEVNLCFYGIFLSTRFCVCCSSIATMTSLRSDWWNILDTLILPCYWTFPWCLRHYCSLRSFSNWFLSRTFMRLLAVLSLLNLTISIFRTDTYYLDVVMVMIVNMNWGYLLPFNVDWWHSSLLWCINLQLFYIIWWLDLLWLL